jgi:hypothetical protein
VSMCAGVARVWVRRRELKPGEAYPFAGAAGVANRHSGWYVDSMTRPAPISTRDTSHAEQRVFSQEVRQH